MIHSTAILFALPARFLKTSFSFNLFLQNLNEKSRIFDLKICYFELTPTCVNRRANWGLDTLELDLTSKQDLYDQVKRVGPISCEITFLIFCIFEGSEISLQRFFKWWTYDIIDFDLQEVLFYLDSKNYNRFWVEREINRFMSEKVSLNQGQKNLLASQRELLLYAPQLGDAWGDALISNRFNLIWRYSSNTLGDVDFQKNTQVVKKFLTENCGGWKLIFPVGLDYVAFTNQSLNTEKYQLRLVLEDYLVQSGPITNTYHNQRCLRCNYSGLDFGIASLRELFPTVGFSEIERFCVITDVWDQVVSTSLLASGWARR